MVAEAELSSELPKNSLQRAAQVRERRSSSRMRERRGRWHGQEEVVMVHDTTMRMSFVFKQLYFDHIKTNTIKHNIKNA